VSGGRAASGAAARSCGEVLVELLEARGVEVVFGIPGVHTLELYRGLARSGIRHVSARHEQGAAFMACGFARVSGRPGVCVLITGPGVTNAATAVASAYHDSLPLLIVASSTALRWAGRARGSLHELPDQCGLMSSIAAHAETVSEPERLEEALDRAYAALAGPRPRPAYVGVPVDVLERRLELRAGAARAGAARAGEPPAPALAAAQLERAVVLLGAARRPLILLGGGAIDAGGPALQIATATGAPIVTTLNGKGAVPERHPACLGATLTLEPVCGELEHADVVLAVGTEFSEVDYYYAGGEPRIAGALIRVDADPAQLARGPAPAAALAGDARSTLSELAARLAASGRCRHELASARAAELRAGLRFWPGAERFFPALDQLQAALPDEAIVAADSTQFAYVANSYLAIARPRSYLCPAGYGTLGPALPMAIGAKLAAPERPVCCLIGDGGLLFTASELASAAQLRLPLAVILYNNRGYGEIREAMDAAGVARIGTDASAPDFLELARGLGCEAVRAAAPDELPAALARAFAAERPTLIELPDYALA
jgi:acetolactate synthase-1/2/3 large subunit